MKHQRTVVVVMFLLCVLPLLHAQELSKAVGGAYANVSVRAADVVGSSEEHKGRYPGVDGGIVKAGQEMVTKFRMPVELQRIRVNFYGQRFKVVINATPFICSVPGSWDSEEYTLWISTSGSYRLSGNPAWYSMTPIERKFVKITTNRTVEIIPVETGRGYEGVYYMDLRFFKNDKNQLPSDKISGKYMATVTVRLEGL
jgi:hypothetical protein